MPTDVEQLLADTARQETVKRINRKIIAWGIAALIAPRILDPLNLPPVDKAELDQLETIESLLPNLCLWAASCKLPERAMITQIH